MPTAAANGSQIPFLHDSCSDERHSASMSQSTWHDNDTPGSIDNFLQQYACAWSPGQVIYSKL